jgi:hypothetical protein
MSSPESGPSPTPASPAKPDKASPGEAAPTEAGPDHAGPIAEAELLLAHASRQGLSLETADIAGVVQARHALQRGTWTPEVEIAFWQAFDRLARLAQPVSVTLLRSAGAARPQTPGRVRRHILYYQIGSIAFLLLMLAFQAYWLMGSMLMEDIRAFDARITTLSQERRNLEELLPPEKRPDSLELNRLRQELDAYLNRKQASYDILETWKPSAFLPPALTFADNWSSATARATTEIEMRFTLQVLQLYLLPLCYGLLGAFAYLLRGLARDLRDLSLLAETKVNYRLRLQLGALAGLAIGWFIRPELSLGALSPLAIAFLAGYSVEMLFAAMDRLIARLSGPGHPGAEHGSARLSVREDARAG